MNFPQIRLQSQNALIEMTTTLSKQSIEQPSAVLDLQQPKAELTINRTPSMLSIDQSEARADVDLKSIRKRVEEFARNGYQDWLNGLARKAQDGNELMRIEKHGNAIANISKRNSERPTYDFNIGFVPKAGSVKIDFEPGKVDIEWKTHKPINQTRAQKPIIDYQPGNVIIGMKQYQSLKIDFVNLKYVGFNFEQEI